MGNQYGCICPDSNQNVIFPDLVAKEVDLELIRNNTKENLCRLKTNVCSDLERFNSSLKECPAFKPALSEKVKEVILRIAPFEKADSSLNLQIKGPFLFENNTVYVGEFNDFSEKEGYGILYFSDGGIYEGYYKNDKMNGKGRLINTDGDYFLGEFENDKANGIGTYESSEGVIYKGSWQDDKQHGYGEELYLDGSMYEGNFERGTKKGKGKFTWADSSYYKGDFHKNVIDGLGIYYFKDGRIYKGDWKDNKMHGLGIFTWPDKKKYIGEYKHDKKDGNGIFIWPNGRKYEGGWHIGKQDGFGCMTISGIRKYGEWKQGNKMRWLDESLNNTEIKIQVKESAEKIYSMYENIEENIN